MKKNLVLFIVLFCFSCKSSLQNTVILSDKDRTSEVKMVFVKYRKSNDKYSYYGKATIKNISKDKVLEVNGLNIKNENNKRIYNVYFDSIASILLSVKPLEFLSIDVVTSDIPKDEDLQNLKIILGFPTRDTIIIDNKLRVDSTYSH